LENGNIRGTSNGDEKHIPSAEVLKRTHDGKNQMILNREKLNRKRGDKVSIITWRRNERQDCIIAN
jgi:hypothetical protein